jgi:integrase/recombinase XerD
MGLGYLESFKIRLIKAVKQVKDTYTKQEIEKLLKKPNIRKCNYVEYRSWVITNTLLGTGIRANTLINLKIKDVDLNNDLLFLSSTKSKKQQIIPIPLSLVNILDEYIQIRLTQTNGDLEEWLFVSAYGQKLNRNSLNHSIRNYNNKRKVLRQGVHCWRHTFAKMALIDGKIDSLRLQRLLGHADLDMVKEYVEIFTEDLQKDVNTYNPLEIMLSNNNKANHLKINK